MFDYFRKPGKLLRESDLRQGGADDKLYFWDEKAGRAVAAPGTMGSEQKSLALEGARPALEGRFQVDGIAVQPAYVYMKNEAMKFSPEATREKTGIHPDVVREEARHFAAAKKAVIASGFASAKMLNGIYTQWAQCLMCALTGHVGERGGY